jgi:hypothetical protein
VKTIAKVVSLLALGGTILPPTMFLLGRLDLEQVKVAMLAGTLLWFASAPLWMDKK